MEWNQKNLLYFNTNLVFILWLSSLLLMTIILKNNEKNPDKVRKFPGINIKEF